MNYVISVVSRQSLPTLTQIHDELGIPLAVTLHGHGTAVQSMLELLGIDSASRRIVMAAANEEKTAALIREAKRRLYIGVPGHGIIVSVPMKSIGGGRTVSYLNGGEMPAQHKPEINGTYELIVAIANEGRTDTVMNAARSAGCSGGTVLHGKGTAPEGAERFLNVSIATEKEVILIVAKREQKAQIMRAVLEAAGPGTPAGTVLFSLPVTDVAGFGLFDEKDQ